MPVEFSVAAYRLGHSMIRPGYRLNDVDDVADLPGPVAGIPEGLTGFRAMNQAGASTGDASSISICELTTAARRRTPSGCSSPIASTRPW